ncbi:MAG TPA: site-specific integrase [Selenomonadales bacterium]|nr:site-specific integrase [Selenomonadales bacterium]
MPRQKANGEGSIVQLPNKKYKGTITIDVIYNPDNTVKKQIRNSFTHEKKGEVQKWLNEQINQKQKKILVRPSDMTLKQWLDNWIERYKKNTKKTRTVEGYQNIIKNQIVPHLGKKKIQDIKTSDLQDLYNKLIESGLSRRTIEYVHATIRASLNQAVREGILGRNIALNCELPEKQQKEAKILTKEQIKKLLEAVKNERLYPLLVLEIGTGLRRGEILALHWHNINLDEGYLTVEGSIIESKSKGVAYQESPKTRKSKRIVFLPDTVIQVLKDYNETTKHDESDIVFTNRKGGYIRPSTFTQTFKYYWLPKAGIKDKVSFHSLRHTHASQLITQNIPMKAISERLGHSTINITMDTYGHIEEKLQRQAAESINNIFEK